ncbi:urease accessory protein UreD [Ornithinimicrobium cavernae]|uniref:urease accessory protein UreD n=1 Tax=Ornithinimicrobium cavernae TaxID=2666047 RepID=UPI000D69FA7E|nr:urease accessory protein UreD [Ornithinimicrobium cavernae]
MSRPAPAQVSVANRQGTAQVTRLATSTFVRPRVLGVRGDRVSVALVAACATLLAGDDLRLEIDVGPDSCLELIEPSGTVAYDCRGGRAHWSAVIRVAEGGRLLWPAAPFVVSHGADVHRSTQIELAPGGTVLMRETLVLGRSGEVGGSLRASLSATAGGAPLLVEDLDLTDDRRRSAPGVLGTARVLATVALLGAAPSETAHPHETLLAGPGALRRAVTQHAHDAEAALDPTWERWRQAQPGA